jgi:acetyl esterase
MAQSVRTVVLEPAAQDLVRMTANPPFIHELGPDGARAKLTELQSTNVDKPAVQIEDLRIPGGPSGEVPIRIVRPKGRPGQGGFGERVRSVAQDMLGARVAQSNLPVILYLHGGGWVLGDSFTHDRLIRELATQADAAVVFPEFTRSPEARYPTALEQCYAVAQWIAGQGMEHGLDAGRMAIAGDSVGGNMAAALTLLAKQRNGPWFREQVLFYPVTDSDFETGSYREFAEGYYLSRETMMWFWDQYQPDVAQRSNPMASPLRASIDQLRGLPPALIVTNEADVLRDEGEAYAAKLRQAGVSVTHVRYQGIIHDMVMLDALAETQAAKAATFQAAMTLRMALQP